MGTGGGNFSLSFAPASRRRTSDYQKRGVRSANTPRFSSSESTAAERHEPDVAFEPHDGIARLGVNLPLLDSEDRPLVDLRLQSMLAA
jgi:hypothetical protein